jgi:hypothetical protein
MLGGSASRCGPRRSWPAGAARLLPGRCDPVRQPCEYRPPYFAVHVHVIVRPSDGSDEPTTSPVTVV